MSRREEIRLFKQNEKVVPKKNQTGQTLIEALVFFLALIVMTNIILILFWIFVNLLWMEHQLYQGILCVAQQKELFVCEHNVLTNIKKLNDLGDLKSLNLKPNQGELLWKFYKQDFLIKQSLSLPQ